MHPDQPTNPFELLPASSRPKRPKRYGPGRPRTLDDGKRREICALIAGGCGLNDAARYVNCSVSTIRREAERNPDFLAQLRHSEKHARLSPLRAMQQAMGTHWRAAAWFLERAFPDRFARPEPSAFGPREAREVMKEIVDLVGTEIRDPFHARRLKKGVRRCFDRCIRTASDRRHNARSFRAAVKSLEAEPELADPVVDLDSLMQLSQPPADQPAEFENNPEFDQKLTAENPFVRRTEPLGHTTLFHDTSADGMQVNPDPLHQPTEHRAPSAPLASPDCNIQ
jgi:Helix-turn-helix domain